MQTRREQVRAYRFVTRRIVSALMSAEPETTDLPMRRLGLAVFSSVILAAVVVGAVGAYGALNPGGGRPDSESLIVERETGARYVYRDNALYPVLNYTSARLILGVANPPVRLMSQRSLSGLVRRRPVGIPNAPDALPGPNALVGLPWSVCNAPRASDVNARRTSLWVGAEPAATTALQDAALLVSDADGQTRYLVWRDQRMAVTTPAVLVALGLSSVEPVPVGSALVNAITAGPDLAPITLPDTGKPSGKKIKGVDVPIGRIYSVAKSGGTEYYIMTGSGLAAIGEVAKALLMDEGTSVGEISAEDAGNVLSDARIGPKGLPTTMPKLWQPRATTANGVTVCATYRGAEGSDTSPRVGVLEHAPPQLAEVAVTAGDQVSGGVRSADQIVVEGGKGALVRAVPAPGATANGTPLYLITDQGIKYQIPGDDASVQTMLGYESVTPARVPSALLALIPTGPALDPAVANGTKVATPTARPSPSPTPSSTRSRKPSSSTSPKPKPSSPARASASR